MADLRHEVDALFATHQDLVYAACLRYLRHPERARDIAQDALLRAYLKLETYRGEARFTTWLVGIARYECLNALRKGRDLLTEDGVLEAEDDARSVLSALRRQEREALLREAAAAVLDDDEQEAVYLRYTEQLPVAQIDAVLQLAAASGARGLLQRCRRKLRAELQRRLAALGHGASFLVVSQDG